MFKRNMKTMGTLVTAMAVGVAALPVIAQTDPTSAETATTTDIAALVAAVQAAASPEAAAALVAAAIEADPSSASAIVTAAVVARPAAAAKIAAAAVVAAPQYTSAIITAAVTAAPTLAGDIAADAVAAAPGSAALIASAAAAIPGAEAEVIAARAIAAYPAAGRAGAAPVIIAAVASGSGMDIAPIAEYVGNEVAGVGTATELAEATRDVDLAAALLQDGPTGSIEGVGGDGSTQQDGGTLTNPTEPPSLVTDPTGNDEGSPVAA